MARPARQKPAESAIDGDHVDHEALAAAHQALDVHATQIALVDAQYGVDMRYDYDRFVSMGRQLITEASQRMFELGKILIQLRERESRSLFIEALDRMGIGERFAYRAIQSAMKFGLSEQHEALAVRLGSAKLLELLAEDDDQIAALADGGTLAGLTQDDIDTMSTRELRAALRCERKEHAEDKAATEEIIAGKDERINKLLRDRRKSAKSGTREQVADLLAELDQVTVELAANLKLMRDTTSSIRATYDEAGAQLDEDVAERLDQNHQWAASALRQVAEELGD